jgi:hypothetical protein
MYLNAASPLRAGMQLSSSVWVVKVTGPDWITGARQHKMREIQSQYAPGHPRPLLPANSNFYATGGDFGVEAGVSGACGIAAAAAVACGFNVCAPVFSALLYDFYLFYFSRVLVW